jgi:hypothetical protein
MLPRMQRAVSLLAAIALASCTSPLDESPVCGEGTEAVIVTALNGYLDDVTPLVEIQLRVPATCEVQDGVWMVWDEESEGVVLVDTPEGDEIVRQGVQVDDALIFFERENIAVRLDYPTDAPSRELTLTWYTPPMREYAVVHCAADGEALACSVQDP